MIENIIRMLNNDIKVNSFLTSAQLVIKAPVEVVDISEVLNRFNSLIVPIAVILFVFAIIYGGFIKMTAGFNPTNDAKWMNIMKYASMGISLIFLAVTILYILGGFLGLNFI